MEARQFLGSEGLLWTEYVATSRHMEYMLWPRLAALDVNFRPLDD
ncbi:family 20 glycosylhydrolase [Geothrix sp. 21YS21S-2]